MSGSKAVENRASGHATPGSRSKLRVLRISHSATVDAYRERDRQLSKREGIELELITPKYWDHLGGKNEDIKEKFQVYRATTFGTGSVPLFAFDPLVIKKALHEFKPDIVDVHEEPYSVSGYECVLLSQLYAPDAACVFYSAQNILKRYPPPFCWTEQYVFKHSFGAYPCSEGVQTVLETKGFARNSAVIPLGVDLDLYTSVGSNKRADYQIENGQFVIGYFGRIESYKGIQYLVEAVARNKEANWRLLVVGSGPYDAELRTLASNLAVSERIIWTGPVAGTEVPAYMRSCDLIAVPSLTTRTWKEQFGRIIVESMACGVPCVAFDSGSLPEVVSDAGLVVAEGNAAELTQAIDRVATDPVLKKTLRERGLERARREYSWGKVAQLMHDMYDRAIMLRNQSRS